MTRNLIFAALLGLSAGAHGTERNDIPDCYSHAKVNEFRQAGSGRELTVIIDQTVLMPESIQKSAWGQIDRFVAAGDKVKLYSFSAFLPTQFMQLHFAGELNAALPEKTRDSVGMQSLRALDKCIAEQKTFFHKRFGSEFVAALRGASEDIPRSEIFHSLRDIGADLRTSPAQERVILLMSDMLENSDFGSFYANKRIRDINPEAELEKIAKDHLFADLDGARVYVAGAGLITKDINQAYRSGRTVELLEAFWSAYFQESKAELVAFGAPSLNVDIR